MALNELERIKDILFGHEKQALDAITRRLERPESRTADIADVLPQSIERTSAQAPERLSMALQAPVENVLRESIRRDPKTIADAIFPAMGPAIRRYISAAVRSMVQSLSRTIEIGLSPRRQVAWRWNAWRAGVSFPEYVMQRTLRYRVEHAYLIQPGSGLLMAEAHHSHSAPKDSDAVSAMFMALQDFVGDSFQVNEGDRLQRADVGDFTLWGIHGHDAMLACAIRGVAAPSLRNDLTELVETMHVRYGERFKSFDGDPAGMTDVTFELERVVDIEQLEDDVGAGGARRMLPLVVIAVTLLAAVTALSWLKYREHQRLDALTNAMREAPGVVVTQVESRGREYRINGLRDPLAASLDTIVERAGLLDTVVIDQTEPYQSLAPSLILQRAREVLAPGEGVSLEMDGAKLRIGGTASRMWIDRAVELAVILPGIELVDVSQVGPTDDALIEQVRSVLVVPDTVQLSLQGKVLSLSGTAGQAWLNGLRNADGALRTHTGLDLSVDASAVQSTDSMAADMLLAALAGRIVRFEAGVSLRPGQPRVLDKSAEQLLQLGQLAELLGRTPAVSLIGYTDGFGEPHINRILRRQRADVVRTALIERGVPGAWISVDSGPSPGSTDIDFDLRKTELVTRLGASQ